MRNHVKSARRPSRRDLVFDALERREVLALIGPEVAVNTKLPNHQYEAAAASSYGGRTVVVWTDIKAGADTDIRARLFDANGTPLGPDFIVNSLGVADSAPAVAMDTVGEFVVAWTRRLPTGDTNVQAARFSAAGVNLGGFNSSITVAGTARRESDPSIAVNRAGAFVVSYTVAMSPTNDDIRARMYTDAGGFLMEIPVATGAGVRETRSSVARILDGRFAIAYQTDAAGISSNVMLRRYTAGGGLVGIHNIAGTTSVEQAPSVAMDEGGNGVVAYEKVSAATGSDIKARRFTAAGVLSPEINVRSTPLSETVPAVALAHGGGRFVAAYTVSLNTVQVAEFSAVNAPVFLASLPRRYRPAVSIDAQGVYQVAYTTVMPDGDGSGVAIRRRRGVL